MNTKKVTLKLIPSILMITTLLFISSCEKKSSPNVDFSNSSGELILRCHGEKTTSFDPWTLVIEPVYKDSTYTGASIEVYVDEPSKDNISVEWTNEKSAVITITEQDGAIKTIPVNLSL
jgi:hypothetical protein